MAAAVSAPPILGKTSFGSQDEETKTLGSELGEGLSPPFNDWPNDAGFDGADDRRSPTELSVTGRIPVYASGTLYRTGPGGYQVQTQQGITLSASHWFDGFSQVHRFQIVPLENSKSQTKVFYNSRTTVDKLVEQIRSRGEITKDFSFAQKRDPCQSYFKKVMSTFQSLSTIARGPVAADKDTVNVGVTLSPNFPGLDSAKGQQDGHASGLQTLWAKTDSSVMKELDPETLEPVGLAYQESLHPDLTGPLSSAHAKSDPLTGDVFNYNLELGRRSTYRFFRVSASTGETDVLATITDAEPAYLHSFFLSENYVILCVWNSYFTMGGLKVLWEMNIMDSLAPFDSKKNVKWFVVDRKHGKGVVATYESPPFYCFHTINAYEEPSPTDPGEVDIVADLTVYENLDVLKKFYYENFKSTATDAPKYAGHKAASCRGNLNRWRLPNIHRSPPGAGPHEAKLVWSAPKDSSPELPTINPLQLTRPHRFVYGTNDRGLSTLVDGLVKVDGETQQVLHWGQHAHTPGEPIFVPDPEGKQEDDGVVLSVVLDGMKGQSYLLCLDARTMREMGRAEVGSAVGFGFHGVHVPKTGWAVAI
ncbi:MAG: hypothetical protein M1833_002063 [Piccolia ochrophora]|nr:MAG: hypothetical protein M1833_002063 [Piccolia ochrophora]